MFKTGNAVLNLEMRRKNKCKAYHSIKKMTNVAKDNAYIKAVR